MKKTGKLAKIIAATLLVCMLFALTSCLDAVGGLRVKDFTVDRNSVKTEYYIGDAIDFSGIKVTVTYSDETYNTVYGINDVVITYPEDITATVGTKDVKVTMKDPHTDEKNEAKKGDTVRIAETRPLSRCKRWRLIEIISHAEQE